MHCYAFGEFAVLQLCKEAGIASSKSRATTGFDMQACVTNARGV